MQSLGGLQREHVLPHNFGLQLIPALRLDQTDPRTGIFTADTRYNGVTDDGADLFFQTSGPKSPDGSLHLRIKIETGSEKYYFLNNVVGECMYRGSRGVLLSSRLVHRRDRDSRWRAPQPRSRQQERLDSSDRCLQRMAFPWLIITRRADTYDARSLRTTGRTRPS